jgi:hypothetical protein
LPITLDYDLIFRILNNGFNVKFLEDTTAIYRRHDESVSGKLTSMIGRLEEETRVLRSFLREMKEPTLLIRIEKGGEVAIIQFASADALTRRVRTPLLCAETGITKLPSASVVTGVPNDCHFPAVNFST